MAAIDDRQAYQYRRAIRNNVDRRLLADRTVRRSPPTQQAIEYKHNQNSIQHEPRAMVVNVHRSLKKNRKH